MVFCERLRKCIEALEVVHDGQAIRFTVSLGISEATENTASYADWLSQADKALYQSKETGRNRTTIYQ
jgi:diguanylate cyclase (GGDEF)-like protein